MEGILKWDANTNLFVINFTDPFGNSENYQISKKTNSFPPGYIKQLDGELVEFTFVINEDGIRFAEINYVDQSENTPDIILENELRDRIINLIRAFASPHDSANRILELFRDSKYKSLFQSIEE